MTEKEQLQYLRAALLQIIEFQENLGALKLVLIQQRVLDLEVLQAADARLRELWKPFRDAVSKLGEESGPSPDELLRIFEGPIQ